MRHTHAALSFYAQTPTNKPSANSRVSGNRQVLPCTFTAHQRDPARSSGSETRIIAIPNVGVSLFSGC